MAEAAKQLGVRERPVLFSGPMVKAILEGRKSQTRRLVDMRDISFIGGSGQRDDPGAWGIGTEHGCWVVLDQDLPPWTGEGVPHMSYAVNGPFEPGMKLWVKESYRLRADQDHKKPSEDWWKSGASWYEADGPCTPSGCGGGAGKLRPGIFMPRWASRITLEVTGVRVERLQQITEDDARAEGVTPDADCIANRCRRPHVDRYFDLWDELNAKRAPWRSNPWVWVVSFRRLEPA